MTLYRLLFLTSFLFSVLPMQAQQTIAFDRVTSEATVFSENFISTSLNERDFALSPDGSELYFTISTPQSTFQTIVFSTKDKNGTWSNPEVVSFAGNYSDLEPAFSIDGKKMYFASNRPVSGKQPKDFDIWVVERSGSGWGEPTNLGPPVNTEFDEFYPSLTKRGNLYFTAQYKEGVGREDIFMAVWNNKGFEKPVALDTTINSKGYEFNAFIDPDEQFILFTGYGRKDDTGRGDVYMSVKDGDDHWLPARNLKILNSSSLDYCPYVSPDKKILFFTSERSLLPTSFEKPASYNEIKELNNNVMNGKGNIYWIRYDTVRKSFEKY